MMLCANPKCQFHIEMAPEISPHAPVVRYAQLQTLPAVGAYPRPNIRTPVQEVRRYLYRHKVGTEYYLCGCCHSAVQMFGG